MKENRQSINLGNLMEPSTHRLFDSSLSDGEIVSKNTITQHHNDFKRAYSGSRLYDHFHAESSLQEEILSTSHHLLDQNDLLSWFRAVMVTDNKAPPKFDFDAFHSKSGKKQHDKGIIAIQILNYEEIGKISKTSNLKVLEITDNSGKVSSQFSCIFKKSEDFEDVFFFRQGENGIHLKFEILIKQKTNTASQLVNGLKSKFMNSDILRASKAILASGKTFPDKNSTANMDDAQIYQMEIMAAESKYVFSVNSSQKEDIILNSPNTNQPFIKLSVRISSFVPTILETVREPDWPMLKQCNGFLNFFTFHKAPRIPTWSRFWANLLGYELVLYEFSDQKRTHPVAIMDLKNMAAIKSAPLEKCSLPNCFMIVTNNGLQNFVQADSYSKIIEWMEVLMERINLTLPFR